MGELGDPVFVPTLLELAVQRNDVGRAALESLAKLTGQDFSRNAEGEPLPRDTQVSLWQAWYRRQQLADVADRPSEPAAGAIPATFTVPVAR